MTKPIRVLQGFIANDSGGLTKYILRNYERINKEEIQFDFLTFDDDLKITKQFEKYGAHFFVLPKIKNLPSFVYSLYRILKNNEYKIVHFNMAYANVVPAVIAKIAGVERIIWHSHSAGIDSNKRVIRWLKKTVHVLGKQLLPFLVTDYWACSRLAAKWMFFDLNKVCICNNAIDTKKFMFDKITRQKVREELSISDETLLLGHIGRMCHQKNQIFLLDVYFQVLKMRSNTKLLMIGEGPLERDIKEYAIKLGIDKNIIFLKKRNDITDLMQAMDLFLLPSLFEGLPIVLVEAQANGLMCIVSDKITREACINKKDKYKIIGLCAHKWVDEILRYNGYNRSVVSSNIQNYDIGTNINIISHKYKNMIDN